MHGYHDAPSVKTMKLMYVEFLSERGVANDRDEVPSVW